MKPIWIIIAFLLFLSLFSIAQASGPTPLVPCGNSPAHPCTLCDLFVVFKNLVDFFLWRIVPPLAAIMIVVGGFYFILGQGRPENIEKAKDIFLTAFIGLMIIYGAWLLVNLFFQFIGVERWTNLHKWWQIVCSPSL